MEKRLDQKKRPFLRRLPALAAAFAAAFIMAPAVGPRQVYAGNDSNSTMSTADGVCFHTAFFTVTNPGPPLVVY